MTQQQAESVKNLAKPVVEALPRITERICPECKGKGSTIGLMDRVGCKNCNGTGKVKWKWEPDMFDLYYYATGNGKIRSIDETTINDATVKSSAIPILHWQEIERVLEGVGHKTYTSVSDSGNALCQICFPGRRKGRHNVMAKANGKSRLIAVYEATIKLAEEINVHRPTST